MDPTTMLNLGIGMISAASSLKNLIRFDWVAKEKRVDLPARERIGIAKLTPVIYSGTAGGEGECKASADPNKPESYILDAEIPPDTKIIGAWYTPFHNIPAVNAFALIDVERHNDTHVKLDIAAFPNIDARLRIAIHVLYAK